jgi:colanic acid/amylovoran biosynthesis glycosyltransferase
MSAAPRLDPDKPVVAVYRGPLFNPSETFVQAQAASLSRYQPLILGREIKGNVRPELEGKLLLSANSDEVRRFSPRLIHAHFATDGLAALPLARSLGVPLATTLHGYEVSRSMPRLLLSGRASWMRYALFRRRLMAQGDLFLAVSEAIRQRAVAQGFPAERTVTHYIGADLDRFRPAGASEAGLVLHVGRLVEKKGTACLLEAFARLRNSEASARLIVIGDGPLRSALERQAESLGLGAAVIFLGRQPPDVVLDHMRRSWLIAAPSVRAGDGDSEGLPTVLVEAAACGLPAVATEHSGIPEVVIDGKTGFTVRERDVEALTDRLRELLASADLRHRMGLAARALAEDRFDLARQTAILEDHYDALLRER